MSNLVVGNEDATSGSTNFCINKITKASILRYLNGRHSIFVIKLAKKLSNENLLVLNHLVLKY